MGNRGSTLKLKLDINGKCEGKCTCSQDDSSIPNLKVEKKPDEPVPGFTKRRHYLPGGEPFRLNGKLQDGGKIGSGQPIEKVTEVTVYYWNGNGDIPILLEINDAKANTKYYSRVEDTQTRQGNWRNRYYTNLTSSDLYDMLDDQNGYRNRTLPIDLKDPSDLKPFYSRIKGRITNATPYLSKDSYISSSSTSLPSLPKGAKCVHEVKSYQINSGKRISRLTYNGQPTNIVPPHDPITLLRIYTWNNDPGKLNSIPLLVEFINKDGKHEWHENLGERPNYTKWKRITKPEVIDFYNPLGELNYDFRKKFNEVNCKINNVVQIDIRKQPDKTTKGYCHGFGDEHTKKISVELDKKVEINEFGAYKHYMKASSGYTNFRVSGFDGDLTLNGFSGLPFRDVTEVIVFSRRCPSGEYGKPIVIYVNHKDEGKNKWYQRKTPMEDYGNTWQEMSGMDDDPYNNTNIEKIKEKLREVAKSFDSPCVERKKRIVQSVVVSGSSGQSQSSLERSTVKGDRVKNRDEDALEESEADETEQDESSGGKPVVSPTQVNINTQNNAQQNGPTSSERTSDVSGSTLVSVDASPSSGKATPEASKPVPPEPPAEAPTLTTSDVSEDASTPLTLDFHTSIAQQEAQAQYLPVSDTVRETRPPVSDPSDNSTNINISVGVPTGILTTSALACFGGWKLYNRYNGDPWVRQI